jgi:hypothetical protein
MSAGAMAALRVLRAAQPPRAESACAWSPALHRRPMTVTAPLTPVPRGARELNALLQLCSGWLLPPDPTLCPGARRSWTPRCRCWASTGLRPRRRRRCASRPRPAGRRRRRRAHHPAARSRRARSRAPRRMPPSGAQCCVYCAAPCGLGQLRDVLDQKNCSAVASPGSEPPGARG